MNLKFHNTLTRSLESFEPIEGPQVRMYTCGPTVYNFAHIGNLRAYTFEDLLRRYLKFCGYDVTQVMNLTDVDDKTIRTSIEQGLPLKEFTKKYIDAFHEDLSTLNIEPAEEYPAATDHIDQMIRIIQTLEEKGYAYKSNDGSVYFSIKKFADYGKLAHLDMEGLQAGARVAQDEYEKDNVADFALWKGYVKEDGDVFWDSPWGKGRPGWHIECSAMSMEYLGESFDIHCGGVDNIFPHHEDEIAQSEAATGKQFVKYWLHNEHLIVDGQKMSKSMGNFFTLRDLHDKGFSGREVRYVLIGTHYRKTLNFSLRSLESARSALGRIDEFQDRLRVSAQDIEAGSLPGWAAEMRTQFTDALNDDLGIAGALASIYDLVHAGNKVMDATALEPSEAAAVLALFKDFDRVLGFLEKPADTVDEKYEALMMQREKARQEKNWGEADRIRDELAAAGFQVQDTPQGPKLKRI